MFFIKSLGVIGPPLIESFDPRLLRRSLAIPSGHFGHLFQYFIYLGIKPRICLRSKHTLFRPRGLTRILQVFLQLIHQWHCPDLLERSHVIWYTCRAYSVLHLHVIGAPAYHIRHKMPILHIWRHLQPRQWIFFRTPIWWRFVRAIAHGTRHLVWVCIRAHHLRCLTSRGQRGRVVHGWHRAQWRLWMV